MTKLQTALIKQNEKFIASLDKQIELLEERAKKTVLPIIQRLEKVKKQRADLIKYIENVKADIAAEETPQCVTSTTTGSNPSSFIEEENEHIPANDNILETDPDPFTD